MQEDRISGDPPDDARLTPDQEDAQWQAAVLRLLLDEHPYQLTKLEISRELLSNDPSFDERDALERALRDLEKAGLLQRCESMVLPSKAARHFASLEVA